MNITKQSCLENNQVQRPFQHALLSVHLDFMMQSAEYLNLKVSCDDVATTKTHKDTDTSFLMQAIAHSQSN